MLHTRSLALGMIAGLSVASLGVGFGCQRKKEKNDGPTATKPGMPTVVAAAPNLPPQSKEQLSRPLARIDDVTITVGEFQNHINRQSPYVRARYTSLEKRKEFLDSLIRFEVLAKEGLRRKLDQDPDVQRSMKQVMIQKLMKAEFENKVKPADITDAEMQTFYKEHVTDYNKPEQVRVAAIIVRSKAKANKVAKEALGEAGRTPKGFSELVRLYSKDERTRIRGGDLRYFARESTSIPKPVVAAAFALGKTGAVTGPIPAGNGSYYIIKQTGKRKPLVKQFADVKRQIQNRLYRQKRTKAQKDFVVGLRAKASIKVFKKNLTRVRVDTSTGGPARRKHRK